MYCPNCNLLIEAVRCPVCGSRNIRQPYADDYCFLLEKNAVWADTFGQLLEQNGIPYTTQNTSGAALVLKKGLAQTMVRFYVPYVHYQTALELDQGFFSSQFLDFPDDAGPEE